MQAMTQQEIDVVAGAVMPGPNGSCTPIPGYPPFPAPYNPYF